MIDNSQFVCGIGCTVNILPYLVVYLTSHPTTSMSESFPTTGLFSISAGSAIAKSISGLASCGNCSDK